MQTRIRRSLALITMLLAVGGCGDSGIAAAVCEAGSDAAHAGDSKRAVGMISTCLAIPGLPQDKHAEALEVRAWSYSNLGKHARAVEDQEAALRLRPPSEYRDFINYASYLRAAGRIEESLTAILEAERMEGGKVSMMTQYNKGWSLLELGRHREAVEAFTKGLPIQPDYAFVYWRRGLAYEGLGDKRQARSDFERAATLLIDRGNVAAAGECPDFCV